MKEGFRKIIEKLHGKETPGKNLHSRVKNLAKMGSKPEWDGDCYAAGFIISPEVDIDVMYQPASGIATLLRHESVKGPNGEEIIINSDYAIFPNGVVQRVSMGDNQEFYDFLSNHQDNLRESFDQWA